jgi:hypothetical protein
MFFAILAAVVRPQKHSELIVSWLESAYKRVGHEDYVDPALLASNQKASNKYFTALSYYSDSLQKNDEQQQNSQLKSAQENGRRRIRRVKSL